MSTAPLEADSWKHLEKARALLPLIIAHRRALHSIPEVGLDLPETATFIAAELRNIGLEPTRSGSGLWADIGNRGPCIALRADTDALPVQEATGASYASIFPGRMHACGHDAHAASLLVAARILAGEKNLPYRVRVIFQPGEEGNFGARDLIEAGVLEGVAAIAGGHVGDLSDEMGPGEAAFLPGPMMAAADSFRGAFIGSGGHGAAPHRSPDPISAFAEFIIALNALRARELDQVKPAVISICAVNSGSNFNVIPERLDFKGTARSLEPGLRSLLERRIGDCGRAVAGLHGLAFDYEWLGGYPPLANHEEASNLAEEVARRILGSGRVRRLAAPIMGGEDFAYYLERLPGLFWFLNTQNPARGITSPNHNPRFEIEESLLADFVGVNLGIVEGLADAVAARTL
ncbi:MAG: M20 family metallopeptidase [Spirochaetota bacterium]